MATATPDGRQETGRVVEGRRDARSLLRRFRVPLAVVLGLIFAVHGFTISFDALFAKRNFALTARVTGSPEASVRAWQVAATRDPALIANAAIRSHAAAAIRREPLGAEALRALAFHEDGARNRQRAAELAGLSQDVTRRDELNQILLARFAAREEDVAGAMHHLGIALTTSRRTREEVFALMLPLLSNPEFKQALAGEIDERNEWIAAFTRLALISNGVDVRDLADIFLQARPQDAGSLARATGPDFLTRLARSTDAERTRALFALQYPEELPILRDAGITRETARPGLGLLGWSPVKSGTAGAQLGETASGGFGALAFTANSDDGQPVLRRALFLPTGNYTLTERRSTQAPSGVTASGSSDFRWTVQCENGGAWQQIETRQVSAGAMGFSLPPDCPMQILELQVAAPRGPSRAEIVIEALDVRQAAPTSRP